MILNGTLSARRRCASSFFPTHARRARATPSLVPARPRSTTASTGVAPWGWRRPHDDLTALHHRLRRTAAATAEEACSCGQTSLARARPVGCRVCVRACVRASRRSRSAAPRRDRQTRVPGSQPDEGRSRPQRGAAPKTCCPRRWYCARVPCAAHRAGEIKYRRSLPCRRSLH